MKIIDSNIVTAFASKAIGTRVLFPFNFRLLVSEAIQEHDFEKDRVPGQAYLVLPPEANACVSAGVGKNVDDENAYVLRSHRGKVSSYLKRENAAPVESVAVVVYTVAAYLADPDIDKTEEARILADEDATHVLVAVLASAGPKATLSPYRFVKNLAGGNNEALAWTADEIRAKAREIAEQTDDWSVVAD